MAHWSNALNKISACLASIEWAKNYPTRAQVWQACEEPYWLLFAIDKLGKPTEQEWRILACAFAREALPFVRHGEDRPRIAIETAERYARGEATGEALDAARSAADSAAGNETWNAAESAAESAASTAIRPATWNMAESAARSAGRSAGRSAIWNAAERAAWSAAWKRQCDIIRGMFPMPELSLRRARKGA